MLSWIQRLLPSSTPAKKDGVGVLGEREAERFLRAKGFRVIARNWRSGKDEIDLICEADGILVFVETRTRRTGALVGGYHSVDNRKRKALSRVCRAFLSKARPRPNAFRLDIVEVEHEGGEIVSTRHFENVPLFSKEMGRGAGRP